MMDETLSRMAADPSGLCHTCSPSAIWTPVMMGCDQENMDRGSWGVSLEPLCLAAKATKLSKE